MKRFLSFVFLGVFLSGLAWAQSGVQPLEIERFAKPVWPEPAAWVDEAGRVVSLEDFKGKVVLLNIWATWCPPCVREMPQLDRLQWKYGAAGLVVVPISLDKREREDGADAAAAVRNFYSRYRIEHLGVYIDPLDYVKEAFPTRMLPTSYLINRKGQVVARAGYGDWLGDEARFLIEGELRQTEAQQNFDARDAFWNDLFEDLEGDASASVTETGVSGN